MSTNMGVKRLFEIFGILGNQRYLYLQQRTEVIEGQLRNLHSISESKTIIDIHLS